jgi:hypothetical protein
VQPEKKMIFTTHPTNHCLGIKSISEQGMVIMDPQQNDFTPMDWPLFESKKPLILLLK